MTAHGGLGWGEQLKQLYSLPTAMKGLSRTVVVWNVGRPDAVWLADLRPESYRTRGLAPSREKIKKPYWYCMAVNYCVNYCMGCSPRGTCAHQAVCPGAAERETGE